MNRNFLFNSIEFELSFKLLDEENIFYKAKLIENRGELNICIFPDDIHYFTLLSKRINDEIPYFLFGQYIIVKNEHLENRSVKLNFNDSRLLRLKCESATIYFSISNVKYSYRCETFDSKHVLCYLANTSELLFNELRSVGDNFITAQATYTYKTVNVMGMRCDIYVDYLPNSNSQVVVLKWECNLVEAQNRIRLLRDIISFYYSVPIEIYLLIEQNDFDTNIEYQCSQHKLDKKKLENEDLAYLDIGIKNSLMLFLDAIRIDSIVEYQMSFDVLHNIIKDYVNAQYLDNTSRFLILYSILETCARTEKVDDSRFTDHKNIKEVFDSMYTSFSEKIKLTAEEREEMPVDPQKPNGNKKNMLRKRWDDLKNQITEKPTNNKILQLFDKYNLDNDKINVDFMNEKEVRNIRALRNKIVHDRGTDYTLRLPMEDINMKLSFVVCVIILKSLSIESVKFTEKFPLLNIFKNN